MTSYKAVIKDTNLAEEFNRLTSEYQDHLIELLDKAKCIELPSDHHRLALTVGHVLATLGESVLFPIYRQHPSLTPDQLKGIIEKEAEQHGRQTSSP